MNLRVHNLGNGVPMLKIEATTPEEKKQLTELLGSIHITHLLALRNGWGGPGNSCGSSGDKEGIMSLSIAMSLGGARDDRAMQKSIEAVIARELPDLAGKIVEVIRT